jgi:hypothetical protein
MKIMQSLITFLVMPSAVFDNIKLKPKWIAPFVLVVIGLIMKNWFDSCWRTQSFNFNIMIFVMTTISITILILFSWSFISVFLYCVIFLIKTEAIVSYKKVFSVISYCGVIFLLGEIINSMLIHARLIDNTLYSLPNRFPLGLDILTLGRTIHPLFVILLYSINPFTVWYFIVLSIGLSTVTGLSETRASLLSFLVWLLIVGFVIGVLLLTGGTKISIRAGI